MLPLLQLLLLLPEVAADHRVAVLFDAIDEVLAGHADHAAFPVLQTALVDKAPLAHRHSLEVLLYCSRPGQIGSDHPYLRHQALIHSFSRSGCRDASGSCVPPS